MVALGLLAGLAVGCGDDETSDNNNNNQEITLNELEGTFIGPESAHWDATNNVWYVASFGQNLDLSGGTPDQPAYISRLDADGKVMDARFVEADGDFLGMATLDGTLYVSHATELLAVDIATGDITAIAVPNAGFVNDVAAGNGAVYISDTATNTIYRYTPGMTEAEVFSQDTALVAPNGLYVDGSDVVVGSLGAFPPDLATVGALYKVDAQGAATRFGQLEGAFDGVEKHGDDLIVSDFNGAIYRVDPSGAATLVENFSDAPYNVASTADIGVNAATGAVLIPDLVANKAYLFTLP